MPCDHRFRRPLKHNLGRCDASVKQPRFLRFDLSVQILSVGSVNFEFATGLHFPIVIIVVRVIKLKPAVGLNFSVIILIIIVIQFNPSVILDLPVVVIGVHPFRETRS